MLTLPDFITPPVSILSIGINPSFHSVRAGYPFAFSGNRFWSALNASKLLDEELLPSVEAMHTLSFRYRIGFTDIVKRPTPGVRSLKAADFATGTPVLVKKIRKLKPQILWFHGKVAAQEFAARVRKSRTRLDWGLQLAVLCCSHCFISPNPSPANAAYSLKDIIASYDELAELWSALPRT